MVLRDCRIVLTGRFSLLGIGVVGLDLDCVVGIIVRLGDRLLSCRYGRHRG